MIIKLILMKKISLFTIFIFGFTTIAFCDEPPPFNASGPDSIPIDGRAIFLLAAASSYGFKKLKDNK